MKIKKILVAIVLCISMLFLCSFTTPVSAASNIETKISEEAKTRKLGLHPK